MTKFVAPAIVASLNFDGVEYDRDENGLFDIRHPDHVAAASLHGLVPFDPDAKAPILPEAPARVESDFDAETAALNERLRAAQASAGDLQDQLSDSNDREKAKDAEIAALRAQLEAAQRAPETAGATDTADTTTDAPGNTSGTAGDTGEQRAELSTSEKIGVFLEANPDFTGENLDRDEKVKWLASVGIAIPINSSKVNAQNAVEAAIADYHRDLNKA